MSTKFIKNNKLRARFSTFVKQQEKLYIINIKNEDH